MKTASGVLRRRAMEFDMCTLYAVEVAGQVAFVLVPVDVGDVDAGESKEKADG